MKAEHEHGQYRARLFDEFVYRLLARQYPDGEVTRNPLVSVPHDDGEAITVDFRVQRGQQDILFETTAPYPSERSADLQRATKRFLSMVARLADQRWRAILIVGAPLSHAATVALVLAKLQGQPDWPEVEVWDENKLLQMAADHFDSPPVSLSTTALEAFLKNSRNRVSSEPSKRSLPTGKRENVVVLTADFCSFSRFVHASGDDDDLVASIMGRFYTETRAAVVSHGGVVDKYMGDGLLAYWFDAEAGLRMERCVQSLIGLAVNLAVEWQGRVDLAVADKGLRAGAAMGDVQFIPENPRSRIRHAIGESINVSARLQTAAIPNSLVISNRLRATFFGNDPEFVDIGPQDLRNIGQVLAWRKDYGVTTVA